MNRIWKLFRVKAKGDCDECGHSILYHVPIFGCMKCGCDEFH